MTPIIRGYCTMLELKLGAYTLYEFLDLYEAILIRDERERQQHEEQAQNNR